MAGLDPAISGQRQMRGLIPRIKSGDAHDAVMKLDPDFRQGDQE